MPASKGWQEAEARGLTVVDEGYFLRSTAQVSALSYPPSCYEHMVALSKVWLVDGGKVNSV